MKKALARLRHHVVPLSLAALAAHFAPRTSHAARIGATTDQAPAYLGATSSGSAAPQPVGHLAAEIMVLHATNRTGGAIDPAIGALPALRQPPFSAYNDYRLVSRTRLPLEKSAPATSTLPNGRLLLIALREIVEDRYRVATSINQPGGSTFLPLLEVTTPAGEPFFVAGQSYQDGILVLGITVVR